ncbi:type I restriction-modification system subunit M [Campylobacter sp. MG1]|uniref:type I restriction-modification system subunit M n=1 Tax=Campylobacter sp. MG1 TaxID=2976332 RepID=UPI00226C8FD2|nr:type I restriction-modification system subunit M [Campylobacter sp. MG1]
MTKQELANKIWKTAEELRGEVDANNYKDFILGFLFYKFLSDNLFSFMIKQGVTLDDYKAVTKDLKEFDFESIKDELLVKLCCNENGYFIPYEYSYKAWIDDRTGLKVETLSKALDFFEECAKNNPTYENIFRQLRNNINILGKDNSAISTKIEKIAFIFKDLDFSIQKDFDLVGYIYEYLISMFASNAGKKAGEFYTPHEVSVLISEVIANYLKDTCKEIKLYDPTCGSGSLLITMGKAVKKHYEEDIKIHYYGQELMQTTYDLARMNLIMTNTPVNLISLKNADTLLRDWPCENGDALRVNAIAANPPYSANWQRDNATSDPRFRYGLAPNKKADFAFLQHSLYHLENNGLMGIVLPHGVLFRSGAEEEIRKNLIENNHIYAIVGLPANIFYGTGISTIVMFLTNDINRTSDILFIDASNEFIKDGKKNKLQASNIKKIFDCIVARKNQTNFARLVSKDEVINNNYNLNITRYINKTDDLELDFNALMFGGIPKKDLDKKYFDSLKSLQNDIFANYDDEYLRFNDFSNLKEQILNSKDIKTMS